MTTMTLAERIKAIYTDNSYMYKAEALENLLEKYTLLSKWARQEIAAVILTSCPYCWSDDADCQCWNDE